jgi:hypothetical protein
MNEETMLNTREQFFAISFLITTYLNVAPYLPCLNSPSTTWIWIGGVSGSCGNLPNNDSKNIQSGMHVVFKKRRKPLPATSSVPDQ